MQEDDLEFLPGQQAGLVDVDQESEAVNLWSQDEMPKASIRWAESFRAIRDWLLTSRMFPTLLPIILMDKLGKDATNNAMQASIGDETIPFKHYVLKASSLDGYDPATKMLTCADGTTVEFDPKNLTWTSFLLSLFALPSRPMTLDEKGRPKYSFLQVLYSLAGTSWNPVKETITGVEEVIAAKAVKQEVKQEVNALRDEETVEQNPEPDLAESVITEPKQASFYQWRWTQKKGFLVALAVIRVPLFIAFNLITWPFRFVRSLLKMVTVALFPLLSILVLAFNYFILYKKLDHLGEAMEEAGPNRRWFYQIPAFVLLGILTLAVGIVQYAMSLVCRIGLAFSSPLTSALLAYNSGVLILGEDNSTSLFSRFVGGIGFVLSMALSATLWAITLPLALGALVAAVPALLTPITALSQSPFIANILAWLTQLPFVATVSTAFGTAFGVVGGALTATFGAAIGYVGAFVGVAIPQVVVAFSLILSAIVMPALTFVTWGVEALSTVIMQWVEQRPFRNVFTTPKVDVKKVNGYVAFDLKNHEAVILHQKEPGGDIVVGFGARHIVTKKQQVEATADDLESTLGKQVNMIKVTDKKEMEKILFRTYADDGKSNQRSRFANFGEVNATQDNPVEFKEIEKPVRMSLYQAV
jgi:hypothetical protein